MEEAVHLQPLRRVAYGRIRELGEVPGAVPPCEGSLVTAAAGQGVTQAVGAVAVQGSTVCVAKFPKRLLQSGRLRTLNCISFLFQDYSKRNLTVASDRCVAISGLVDRIAGALECRGRYG